MARDEAQGDLCNLDKYLAAIRRQVELTAEFELTKKPPKKGDKDKKPALKDHRKPKKDDDDNENDVDDKEAKKQANKQKPCYMYRQGVCKKGRQVSIQARPKSE